MRDPFLFIAQATPDAALPEPLAAAGAAAATPEPAPSFSERVSVQWLPTEELLCQLAGLPLR